MDPTTKTFLLINAAMAAIIAVGAAAYWYYSQWQNSQGQSEEDEGNASIVREFTVVPVSSDQKGADVLFQLSVKGNNLSKVEFWNKISENQQTLIGLAKQEASQGTSESWSLVASRDGIKNFCAQAVGQDGTVHKELCIWGVEPKESGEQAKFGNAEAAVRQISVGKCADSSGAWESPRRLCEITGNYYILTVKDKAGIMHTLDAAQADSEQGMMPAGRLLSGVVFDKIEFSPSGNYLILAKFTGSRTDIYNIDVYDITSGEKIARDLPNFGYGMSMGFTPDEKYFYDCGDKFGNVPNVFMKIFSVPDFGELYSFVDRKGDYFNAYCKYDAASQEISIAAQGSSASHSEDVSAAFSTATGNVVGR